MPHAIVEVTIHAPSDLIFDLLHDYAIRLQWDTMLRKADLLGGAEAAGVGVDTYCAGKWRLGGMGMTTRYVSFQRPRLAAVKMLRGPMIIKSFAASIRQTEIAAVRQAGQETRDETHVAYILQFETQPCFRWLDGVVQRMFLRETRQRLEALKQFAESVSDSDESRAPSR